jgi:dihydroorotase
VLLENASIWISNEIIEGQILINEENGLIDRVAVGKILEKSSGHQKINLNKKLVIPGLVDIHVHLRDFEEHHKETYETGSRAAAAGGFTTVFDMPNKKDEPIISYPKLKEALEKAKNVQDVEIIPYLLLSNNTPHFLLSEYSYVKAYLGLSTGGYLTDYDDIVEFLNLSPGFLSVHCEDNNRMEENKRRFENILWNHGKIRDPQSELICIRKLIERTRMIKTRASVHVAHVTLPESIKIIKNAGLTFEVTPHHLFLNDDDFLRLGARGKLNPPLRAKNKQKKLFKMFLNGEIPIISTDHAPHTIEEKEVEMQSGVPGLEICLPLLLDHCKPLDTRKLKLIIDALAINPRKVMNLPGKGIIAENKLADLTVLDLKKTKKVKGEELKTKCKWSPWEGEELDGWPVMTIRKGNIVWSTI